MRIFVTGGAGFIGSNFIRHILHKYPDYEIINYDKLTYAGNLDNLQGIDSDPRYRFIRGDICDIDRMSESIKGCDTVVNFAAESHVDRSISSAKEFLNTNVLGTETILELVRDIGIRRFIHISTDEVYGSTEIGSFKETDRLYPSSPYSASKAAADLLCLAHHTTFDTPVIITRSSNNFGPYQYPEKLIPMFSTNLINNLTVPVYGDGKNIRDWCYVNDNCAAIDTVLHKGETGEIYNIGAGNELSNLEITKHILSHLGKSEAWIKHVNDRLGHDQRYSIQTDKIRALGWTPAHEFHSALSSTIDWYCNNQHWWESLAKI